MKATLLPQLQIFLEVARTKSFTKAARAIGITPSAVSQAVRVLETELGISLLNRTTRSVSLTETGRRLVEQAGPGVGQAVQALRDALAHPGEIVGKLKLTVPRIAAPYVVTPVLPHFLARHPRLEVEVVFEERLVDIVAEGYDAGVRLIEAIERDMVHVRLTEAFRFVIAAAPSYLAKRGTPRKPEELMHHDCITGRSPTTGEPMAWDLEKGRRTWRVPVRGRVVANDFNVGSSLCEAGVGLIYTFEPFIAQRLKARRLKLVLEEYSPTVPGFYLYFPSRAQSSAALRAFVETAREHAKRSVMLDLKS